MLQNNTTMDRAIERFNITLAAISRAKAFVSASIRAHPNPLNNDERADLISAVRSAVDEAHKDMVEYLSEQKSKHEGTT